MNKFLNDELFEIILEKAFIEHEKEEQKAYPDDKELEKRFPISKKEIRKFKRAAKEKEYGQKLVTVYLKRVAVIVLCMVSLFFALMMTSPEVRAAARNVILKWYDKYTEFVFSQESNGLVAEKIEDVEIGYILDGFELEFEEKLEEKILLYFVNANKPDFDLAIEVFYNESAVVSYDNEHSDYEQVSINSGESWYMYNKDENKRGLILVGEYVTVNITGYISETDLFKIAENIN